jgi:hypothetical protein
MRVLRPQDCLAPAVDPKRPVAAKPVAIAPVAPLPPAVPHRGLFDTWGGVVVVAGVAIISLIGTLYLLRSPTVRNATRRFVAPAVRQLAKQTRRFTRPVTRRIEKHLGPLVKPITRRLSKGTNRFIKPAAERIGRATEQLLRPVVPPPVPPQEPPTDRMDRPAGPGPSSRSLSL